MRDIVFMIIDEHGIPTWFPTTALANHYIEKSGLEGYTEIHRIDIPKIQEELLSSKESIEELFNF